MADQRLQTPSFLYSTRKDFDPDLSPENPVNQEAARLRGLTYDSINKAFVDEDGYLIRDEFGQPF